MNSTRKSATRRSSKTKSKPANPEPIVQRAPILFVRVVYFDEHDIMHFTDEDPEEVTLGEKDEDGDPTRTFLYVVDEDGVIELLAHRYIPHEIVNRHRTVKPPMLLKGKFVSGYTAPTVKTYLDLLTGDIIKTSELSNRQIGMQMRFGERRLQREAVLQKLRPEVRPFAHFVLGFRDKRRGVTPNMRKLVHWYAELHDRRPSDVSRYVKRLAEGGVCEGECMTSLFQRTDSNMQRSHYLGEAEVAYYRYEDLRTEKARALHYASLRQADGTPFPPSELEVYRLTPSAAAERARPKSTQLGGQGLSSGVVIPLQHLQRSVPGDGSQLDDVREAIGEPRGSGVPKVMEAQVLQFSTSAESSEHLVQCSNTDWKDGLAA